MAKSRGSGAVNGRDYTVAQCHRWAPLDKDMTEWTARIRSRNPYVVRHEEDILGFAELENNGHIDHFYVHHRWQGRGVGRLLYNTLEAEAIDLALSRLYAESSKTALPFFLRMGFTIQEEQEHFICDALAKRYILDKSMMPHPEF